MKTPTRRSTQLLKAPVADKEPLTKAVIARERASMSLNGGGPALENSQPSEGGVAGAELEPPIAAASVSACSVGVMAYNEEANIADTIRTILEQQLASGEIAELIVVASGCEDQTTTVVADIARRDPRVRLIEQARREGKASAINLFIGAARSPILLMVSADVVLKSGTMDALLCHFHDPQVGMVGGHPIPVNRESSLLGHAVHLQWRLHDRLARESPKLGEIVAFRNLVPSIPQDTAVDEISIQALITQLGYRLVYEPRAVVYNRGPATVPDFLRQRRRIYAGHLRVREQQGYSAPTMSVWRVGRALLGSGCFNTPLAAFRSVCAIGLEATARGLGHYDVLRRKPQHVWEISATTKQHIALDANAPSQHNVLVFHLVNFQLQQLELGAHASRQLTAQVAMQIKRALGRQAVISVERSGTIVALLPGEREAAERAAQDLVQRFEAAPLSLRGRGATTVATLACGIIAFSQAGPPITRAIPVPLLEADLAASSAG
jgi:poly-beta-1,6-N-acetyl-D-glucosamine synthase